MSPEQSVAVGPVAGDELPAFVAVFSDVFGSPATGSSIERFAGVAEPERLVAARNRNGAIVGTAGAYSFDLALPEAPPAGCAGVALVSVRADHRRRGLMRRMVGSLLDDAAERGEPFAALWASEAPIYDSLGFGPAVPTRSIELVRAHAALRRDGPVAEVELVDAAAAVVACPAIYDAHRRRRAGMLSRSEAWWWRELADPPDRREGGGPKRVALLAGRGYAVYRLRPSWQDGAPQGTVEVQDLVANDADAAAALWRFVLDTDLASRVTATRRPADDPIVALLRDTGRADVAADWPLYLRIVDVPGALTARRYATDDMLVLDVRDPLRSHNDGRFRLVVRDGQATCEPVPDAEGDVVLGVTELATILLGGVRPSQLAAAGRLEAPPDVVGRLGRLLATDPAPWHGGMF